MKKHLLNALKEGVGSNDLSAARELRSFILRRFPDKQTYKEVEDIWAGGSGDVKPPEEVQVAGIEKPKYQELVLSADDFVKKNTVTWQKDVAAGGRELNPVNEFEGEVKLQDLTEKTGKMAQGGPKRKLGGSSQGVDEGRANGLKTALPDGDLPSMEELVDMVDDYRHAEGLRRLPKNTKEETYVNYFREYYPNLHGSAGDPEEVVVDGDQLDGAEDVEISLDGL